MMSDLGYFLYYSFVYSFALFIYFFYYILALVFVYEYFIASFKKIRYYRTLLYIAIFITAIKLFYSSLSIYTFLSDVSSYEALFGANMAFSVILNFIIDLAMFILLILILKKFYSPFYKAFFYMQKSDYVNFFKCLKKLDKWWKIHNFKGMSLFQYALFISEKNAIDIMLSKKVKPSLAEDIAEARLLDFIKNIQEKGLSLNLSESEKRDLLFLRLGKNTRFKAHNGLKNIKIRLDFLSSISFASFCANEEIVKLLLKEGASFDDCYMLFNDEFYPESFALINDNFILLDYFLKTFPKSKERLKKFYDKNYVDEACLYILFDDLTNLKKLKKYKHNFRLFSLALILQKVLILEYLLKNYLSFLNAKEKESLLELSIKFNKPQSFAKLSEYKISSNTSFFNAVCANSKDIVKYILDNGYEINPSEMLYLYYLWFDSKSEELFETLKNIGLDFKDKEGESPLIIAAKYNISWAAFELIEAGADKNIRDNEGKDALFYARQNKNKELVKMLELELE